MKNSIVGILRGVMPMVVAAAMVVAIASPAAAKEPLRVGYLSFLTFGGVEVAEQKRWYEEAGLDVELILFPSGPPLLEAMASGSIDVGALGGVPTLRTAAQKVFPLRILSAVADVSSSLNIVATNDIETLDDLRGKDVSVPWGTTQHLVLAQALEQNGMSISDINLIQMESIDGQAAFVAGRLDAVIPVPASLEQVLASRDDLYVLFQPSDFDPPVSMFDVWVAPESVVAERGDEIAKVLQVWHGQVVPYLHDGNMTELQSWLSKTLGSRMTVDEAKAKLDLITIYDSAEMAELARSGVFARMLKLQADFMASVDIIPAVEDFGQYIDTSLLLQ